MSQIDSPNITTLFPTASRIARQRHAAILPAVQVAHIDLMSALSQETPHVLQNSYAADRFDILERAAHLKIVLAIFHTYAKAIVHDTAYMAPIGYVADETGYLVDAASEVTGALENAVDKMIDDQADAAE